MIDTRTKILTIEEAVSRIASLRAAGEKVWAAIALCDPMLPHHVSQMARVAGDAKLVLVIATPEDAYLPVRARAELAASLAFVDMVVIGDGNAGEIVRSLGADEVLAIDQAESVRRSGFIRYVRERAG